MGIIGSAMKGAYKGGKKIGGNMYRGGKRVYNRQKQRFSKKPPRSRFEEHKNRIG